MKRLFYIFISLFICLFSTSCDFETRDYSGTYTIDWSKYLFQDGYSLATLELENITSSSNSKGTVKFIEDRGSLEEPYIAWGTCEWIDYKGLLWIKTDGPFLYISKSDLDAAYDGKQSTIYIFEDVDAAEIHNLNHPECRRCRVRFSKRK